MTHRELMIEALAAELWGRTVEDTGRGPEYQHCCENDLELPAELLERLGYMYEIDGGMAHAFARNWRPGDPAAFTPHEPEVSDEDLKFALIFMDNWRGDPALPIHEKFYGRAPLRPDLHSPMPPAPNPDATPESGQAFRRWAAQRIKALIA